MDTIPEASGTYKSRKFVLTLLGIAILTAVTIASAWVPAIPTVLPTFVGGVLGIMSLYFAGNISNKYVVGKTLQEKEKVEDKEPGDGV